MISTSPLKLAICSPFKKRRSTAIASPYGPELAVLPMTDIAKWVPTGGGSASGPGTIQTVSAGGLLMSGPLAGRTYIVRIVFTKTDSSVELGLRFGTSGTVVSSTASSGVLEGTFIAANNSAYFRLGGVSTVTVSEVSIKEVL